MVSCVDVHTVVPCAFLVALLVPQAADHVREALVGLVRAWHSELSFHLLLPGRWDHLKKYWQLQDVGERLSGPFGENLKVFFELRDGRWNLADGFALRGVHQAVHFVVRVHLAYAVVPLVQQTPGFEPAARNLFNKSQGIAFRDQSKHVCKLGVGNHCLLPTPTLQGADVDNGLAFPSQVKCLAEPGYLGVCVRLQLLGPRLEAVGLQSCELGGRHRLDVDEVHLVAAISAGV